MIKDRNNGYVQKSQKSHSSLMENLAEYGPVKVNTCYEISAKLHVNWNSPLYYYRECLHYIDHYKDFVLFKIQFLPKHEW